MVDIDIVYQKVLALANKEQRGYITPQEFNLMADKAQNDIYNSYFHKYKTGFFKPKSETEAFDDLEMTQQKLDFTRGQWYSYCEVVTTSDNRNIVKFNMPNAYKIATVFLSSLYSVVKGGVETVKYINPMVEVKRVERNDLLNILANPLATPTTNRPIYVNRASGTGTGWRNTYEIYPMATYTGPVETNVTGQSNMDGTVVTPSFNGLTYTQADPVDGIGGTFSQYNESNDTVTEVKGAALLVDYWKKLDRPKWGYVVVRQKALYNSANTTHFELHPAEEENLVMKILELAGIIIEKPQLTKMAMGIDSKTKQEQNN